MADYQLEIVFEMKSMVAEPETGFVGYQGMISLTVTSRGHMTGQFADLGLRRGHYGLIIAERAKAKQFAAAAIAAEQAFGEPAMEQ